MYIFLQSIEKTSKSIQNSPCLKCPSYLDTLKSCDTMKQSVFG